MVVSNKVLRFAVAALLLAAPVACKKDGDVTAYDRLLGKWKQTQFATDDNGNGILDPQELHNVAANRTDNLIFNDDSEGVETIIADNVTTNYPYSWYLLPGDSLQRNGIGHDTILYQIQDITAVKLTLMTNSNLGMAWYIYAKQ